MYINGGDLTQFGGPRLPSQNEPWDPGADFDDIIGDAPEYEGYGDLTWEELEAMFQEGTVQDYLAEEWGIGSSEDYMQYLDAPDYTGMNIAKSKYLQDIDDISAGKKLGMEQISSETGSQISSSNIENLRRTSKSGLETAGAVSTFRELQDANMLKDYAVDMNTEIAKSKSNVNSALLEYGANLNDEQGDIISNFYRQIDSIITAVDADTPGSDAFWDLDPGNDGLFCFVSAALNDTGAWTKGEKMNAVKWCQETHHDGTERGKTWVKGYHIWGKFLSKWTKKSNIVKKIVKVTTTAFIDHVKNDKPNYLGYIIHNFWINPLSYVIGYSKKNKITGALATVGMIGLYTALFPLFGLISIPHLLKNRREE